MAGNLGFQKMGGSRLKVLKSWMSIYRVLVVGFQFPGVSVVDDGNNGGFHTYDVDKCCALMPCNWREEKCLWVLINPNTDTIDIYSESTSYTKTKMPSLTNTY